MTFRKTRYQFLRHHYRKRSNPMNKAYFTFLQYATRKTGLGRTSWFFAIVIHIGALAAIWYGQSMIRDGEPWGWIVAGIGAIMAVGFWLGTRSNYRTDKAREEAGSSNKHLTDVCETCNPVRWNDGHPLTELYQWYAAVQDISWHDAQLNIGNMTTNEIHVLRVTHDKYLSHQQFDKFRS